MNEQPQVGLRGILTLLLATISEFTGLIFWLRLTDNGQALAGIGALTLGMLVERVAVWLAADDAYKGRAFPRGFYPKVIASAFVELVIWIIWLAVWDGLAANGILGPIIATAAMAVMQLFFHSWVMAFSLNRPPFYRFTTDPLTIVFSVIEGVMIWPWIIAARDGRPTTAGIILFVGLTIEHVVQGIAIENASPPDFPE